MTAAHDLPPDVAAGYARDPATTAGRARLLDEISRAPEPIAERSPESILRAVLERAEAEPPRSVDELRGHVREEAGEGWTWQREQALQTLDEAIGLSCRWRVTPARLLVALEVAAWPGRFLPEDVYAHDVEDYQRRAVARRVRERSKAA